MKISEMIEKCNEHTRRNRNKKNSCKGCKFLIEPFYDDNDLIACMIQLKQKYLKLYYRATREGKKQQAEEILKTYVSLEEKYIGKI